MTAVGSRLQRFAAAALSRTSIKIKGSWATTVAVNRTSSTVIKDEADVSDLVSVKVIDRETGEHITALFTPEQARELAEAIVAFAAVASEAKESTT